jgi:hypothetical protein
MMFRITKTLRWLIQPETPNADLWLWQMTARERADLPMGPEPLEPMMRRR